MKKNRSFIMIMVEKEGPKIKDSWCSGHYYAQEFLRSLKLQSKSHYFEGMVPTVTIQELVEERG